MTESAECSRRSKSGEAAEVAHPMGRSEVLSEGVVFGQRHGRGEKAQLAERGDVPAGQRVHQGQVPEAQNNSPGGWSRGSEWRAASHAGPTAELAGEAGRSWSTQGQPQV